MNLLKKKLFNFRPIFCVFISLILGITFSKYILQTNIPILIIFIIILFSGLTLAILKGKIKLFLVFLLSFILGFAFFVLELKTYSNESFYVENIEARVSNISRVNEKYQLVVLDNIKINEEEKSFNIAILNYNTSNLFSVGDVIKGSTQLKKVNLFNSDYFNSTYYRNNIQFYANAKTKDFVVLNNNLKFNEKIQIAVKDKLNKNLTEENSAIAYSMVFGDKTEISSDIKTTFSKTGISHILAISGLHVGILCAVLLFIFKKCKLNKFVSLALLATILILYCYLCSFAPSVVRASIMALILTSANVFNKKYDPLSAIGLAGIIILIFKPFYVFDIGFQLSFACVIGITIFYSSLYNFFVKIKIPKILSKGLAVSVATQIAIIPILLKVFESFSVLSVILNVFIIPIFTVAFIFLILFLPLSFVLNFFANFLYVSELILEVIKISATFVATIPYTFVKLTNVNFALYIGYYTSMLSVSRMSLTKPKIKLIFGLCLLVLTIAYYILIISIWN